MNLFATTAMACAVASTLLVGTALAAPERAENAFLSQADAAARAARVSRLDYALDIVLTGDERFSGSTVLTFDLSDAASDLTLDLNQASIEALEVNGKALAPRYNQWFLSLPAAALVKGKNTVRVRYNRAHSTNGEGLHRMRDPADGKVYTYSHFEPAAANQMFALFDQPDLKAAFTLTVTAPSDWTVVSTTRESAVEQLDGARRWRFPATKKLSAYNFSLHAGPYKVWEDNSGKYPMRLFARQSLADRVTPEFWFQTTRAGLAFFDDYFGIPYQFEKYDQLLVPDFLYGAMENAGAVTFAESRFLQKGNPSEAQRRALASVIMHEMAHQWFGDMVTMQWWNGLWLNESFASFMGTLATGQATEFTNVWQSFYSGAKQNAYTLDQRVVTHPIEVPVASTANAFDNIDAITYSKGASALKQLRHLLGEEVFRQGVRDYLTKYAYGNARLEDFIGSLAGAAKRDLGPWTRDWLYQAGVNTISADYSCKRGKVARFTLRQRAPSKALPTLREQRVQVATFKQGNQGLALAKNVPVTYRGATTAVPQLVGQPCPDLVYPNYQDWGYVKVELDQRSFATARTELGKVADPMLRAMLWQSLWDGVRDGALPLNDYIATLIATAPAERDATLLGQLVGKAEQAKRYVDQMMPGSAYATQTGVALETMAWNGVQANDGDANFQRLWFNLYLDLAASAPALARLAALLDASQSVPGLAIDQDLRWRIIGQLNRHDHPGGAALVEAELARDNSDRGQASAIAARVARPDPAVKAEWLARLQEPDSKLPFARLRTAMGALFPAEQTALAEASAAARLASLARIDQANGPVFMRSYAPSMIPTGCTPASVGRLAKAVDELQGLSSGTRRALLVAHQDDALCVAIRGKMTVR